MAADASVNTEMLSISAGLNRSNPPALAGIPSITINGPLFPSVLVPRIRTEAPSYPGSALDWVATTPGKRPANALETLTVGDFIRSALFTDATDPLIVSLR